VGRGENKLVALAKLAHKKLVWCTERRGRVIDF
jgi:hypothetical protein